MRPMRQRLADLAADIPYAIVGGPFGSKLTSSDYVEEGVPVIRGSNLTGGRHLRHEDLVFVSEQKVREDLFGNLAHKGDIVFTQRGTLGQVALIPQDAPFDSYVVSQSQMKMTVDAKKADARYVYYWFTSRETIESLVSRNSSSGVPHINLTVLRDFQIPVPDLKVQRRIADVLSSYDDLIENNQRRISLLEEAARLLYREWFVRLQFPGHEHVELVGGVPKGWERVSASTAFWVNPSTPRTDEGEITYVPMAALSETGMLIDQRFFERRLNATSVRFQNGDTLFARITPCLENGKTGFVQFLPAGQVACGSTEFIVLRGRRVSNYFVYLTSRQQEFRENAIKSMIGSSGRQRVQPSCFDRYFVLVPPPSLATVFDETVAPLFRQIRLLEQQIDRLADARDLLLPRLMSGELAV